MARAWRVHDMHMHMCMACAWHVCMSTSRSLRWRISPLTLTLTLSQVENVLKECPLVELPLCYARSTESFCIALVCPSHVALKALGKSMGLGEDVPTLCANKQIIAEVSKHLTLTLTPTLTLALTPTLPLTLTR